MAIIRIRFIALLLSRVVKKLLFHLLSLLDFQDKKGELIKGLSFGSSAILLYFKTHRFLSPSYEGFSFLGKQL
jgi:hypothetical protein